MAPKEINKFLPMVQNILSLPYENIWSTYDKKADVLYINFKKPSHADDSELTNENIIIRYENEKVVGLTILNASKNKKNLKC